jgi:hypothetical protein
MRSACGRISSMGFNKRRMESERAAVAAKEAEARRALGRQILGDAERLVSAWNARQEARMPMLIFADDRCRAHRALFLWVRCPACRTTTSLICARSIAIPTAAVTSLVPALWCRSCRPHAPFAELVRLSKHSIADDVNVSRNQQRA